MSIDPAFRPINGRAMVARPPRGAPDMPAHRGDDRRRDAPRDDRRLQSRGKATVAREVSPYLQRRLRSLEEVLQWRQQQSGDVGEGQE